jgi:Protein of unknown function (DUF1440)
MSGSGPNDRGATPLAAVAPGLLAGVAGTAAMDAFLYFRYRRGGGDEDAGRWETSAGVTGWDKAPAPAQVGRRLTRLLLGVELPDASARRVNNITHWAFGVVNGGVYGLVAASARKRGVLRGLGFGASVWAGGYVVLPLAKLYEPIWKYDAKTLAEDLSAHLVYGLATAAAFAGLRPRA